MIDKFYTPETGHSFLSNFYPSPIVIGGRTWPTVEHYFQAAKSHDPSDWEAILANPSPGAAKRVGRTCALRPDWEAIKLVVMRQALEAKFSAGSQLAQQLLDTGDELLVEGNGWGDRFWGVDGTGENWLGGLLMMRRAELRSGEAVR